MASAHSAFIDTFCTLIIDLDLANWATGGGYKRGIAVAVFTNVYNNEIWIGSPSLFKTPHDLCSAPKLRMHKQLVQEENGCDHITISIAFIVEEKKNQCVLIHLPYYQ